MNDFKSHAGGDQGKLGEQVAEISELNSTSYTPYTSSSIITLCHRKQGLLSEWGSYHCHNPDRAKTKPEGSDYAISDQGVAQLLTRQLRC
ncbi:hypothetical protein GJ744_010577 [Endocarpon pusillum]|uniref:Uncharacterized protein n=1 Tax=Endocarpon pusillum TaxID=364733 RepID=A0A8H7AU27_9EURO|nr:hypothetical protein GJ744_010577 [Endocarpon pusillum]